MVDARWWRIELSIAIDKVTLRLWRSESGPDPRNARLEKSVHLVITTAVIRRHLTSDITAVSS